MTEVTDNTLVDGRYRILNRIGSGGMADVYCAEDTHLGRQVALKVLHRRFAQDQEFVERFRREASAAAGLQHPNVVNVYDRGSHDSTYYIAMELLAGRTLKDVIKSEAPLQQERAIDIGIQILRAAGFAHRRGVIHRDFKPHNVMVGAQDNVKVTDFGIARAGASEMTETGSIMGTAQYLSPEQAQGHGVTAASDIYSIGVILYEMLAGRVPFEGESAVSIALKHLSEPPPRLALMRRDINPALEATVMRALAKNPADRYAGAEEFIAALEGARGAIASGTNGGQDTASWAPGTFIQPPLPPVQEVRTRGPRRWPWIVLLVALLLAAAGVGAYELISHARVSVPNEVGKQESPATADLDQRGFTVNVQRVESGEPVGVVIGQAPEAGTKVDKGSTVTLRVSKGPGQVQVPQVEGLSFARASKALTEAGLFADSRSQSSDTVPKGQVISADPPEGSQVQKGSHVRIVVSSGPEQVKVPSLVGQDSATAHSNLLQAGLKYTDEQQFSDTVPKGQVISQSPVAGDEVNKGSQVILTISKGADLTNAPDVSGLSQAEASSQIQRAGLKVQVKQLTVTDQAMDGKVVRQRPQPGTQLKKGRTVVIYVGKFQGTGGGGDTTTPSTP